MTDQQQQTAVDLAERLGRDVLEPMKQAFVAKDEIIDLLGVSLVAGENLFILGPPGTAKSALVHHLAARLEGQVFSYLLTRFTEPNEIFGPFDIRRVVKLQRLMAASALVCGRNESISSDLWILRYIWENEDQPEVLASIVDDAIGRLWNLPDVEVCEHASGIWLRGQHADDPVHDVLRGFLSGQRFRVLADGQIQSPRSRLPKGHLPTGPWQPLREWMTVALPTTALSGQTDSRVKLKLVRSGSMQESDVLLTRIEPWRRYGSEAPQVRLEPLRFAMTSRGEVLVQGRPLPSMEGQRFVVREQIAVPAGWTWSPAVDGSVRCKRFGLDPGDLAVLHEDETWFLVRRDSFVQATRQAIRDSADLVIPR